MLLQNDLCRFADPAKDFKVIVRAETHIMKAQSASFQHLVENTSLNATQD